MQEADVVFEQKNQNWAYNVNSQVASVRQPAELDMKQHQKPLFNSPNEEVIKLKGQKYMHN
jgi:hypothetical protein